jgi:hypothetical protein
MRKVEIVLTVIAVGFFIAFLSKAPLWAVLAALALFFNKWADNIGKSQ